MQCPNCKNVKLRVQITNQSDNYTRIREYGCIECENVYFSIEQLDGDPASKKAMKRTVEKWREERKKLKEKSTS